jgi:copper chaperone CopZ
MCCIGCKAVAEFIDSSGLSAFYDHRDNPAAERGLTPEATDWGHYDQDSLLNRYVHKEGDLSEATIDIGGMYCSACVWLLDNALKQVDGIDSMAVNPATRRAVIRWESDGLPFSELLAAIARVGFKPAPISATEASPDKDEDYRLALKRLIVAAVAGMQVMMFAVALYAGDFFGIEGGMEKFLRTISLLVTLPIVFYSARPFFTAAWRGLRALSPGMDLRGADRPRGSLFRLGRDVRVFPGRHPFSRDARPPPLGRPLAGAGQAAAGFGAARTAPGNGKGCHRRVATRRPAQHPPGRRAARRRHHRDGRAVRR